MCLHGLAELHAAQHRPQGYPQAKHPGGEDCVMLAWPKAGVALTKWVLGN